MDAASRAYSTPSTKVSAAFLCLLDKSLLGILKLLLDLDGDRIRDYTIPGSSFGPLAMYPAVYKPDSGLLVSTDEFSLGLASLYLGNLESFREITTEVTPNDGILHLAALLALPNFVSWLLQFHDPNHKSEDFDNMQPLACVCISKPQPWCKIANADSDWSQRQKDTMGLLAPITSSNWRYRNMTILHWAMENGFKTAVAMIDALDILRDPKKETKHLYKDRAGVEYSPQEYAGKVWDANKQDKITLIAYFDLTMEGTGSFAERPFRVRLGFMKRRYR